MDLSGQTHVPVALYLGGVTIIAFGKESCVGVTAGLDTAQKRRNSYARYTSNCSHVNIGVFSPYTFK